MTILENSEKYSIKLMALSSEKKKETEKQILRYGCDG